MDKMMLRSALRLINVAVTTLLQKQRVNGWYVPLLIAEHFSYCCNCLCEHQSFLRVWTWFNPAAVSQTRPFTSLWFLYSCHQPTWRRLTKANRSSFSPKGTRQPAAHGCAARQARGRPPVTPL